MSKNDLPTWSGHATLTFRLTRAQAEALRYCADYANDRDDEGIRSSDPEAIARTEAIDGALEELSRVLDPTT